MVLAVLFVSVALGLDRMDAGLDPAETAGRGVASAFVSLSRRGVSAGEKRGHFERRKTAFLRHPAHIA